MSVSDGISLVISPITTFLGNDSSLLAKFANLGLAQTTLEEFAVDYVDTNNTDLAKISQILYVVLRDENLTATFKQTLLNATPSTVAGLFALAEADINSSKTIGTEEKIISRAILAKMKGFSSSVSTMETTLKTEKENLAFVNEHGNPFVTVWETNSTDSSITIPTHSSAYTYNYIVDWGDGTVENNVSGDSSHTYSVDGNHTIKIYEQFPAIYFNYREGRNQILMINSWGDIIWKDMMLSFYGCSNLNSNSSDAPILKDVNDLSHMFYKAYSFNGYINNWDVSNITDMTGIFMRATSFNKPLNNWNVSSVKYMTSMFEYATVFNQSLDNWKTSEVITTQYMFEGATSFDQSLNEWDINKVENIEGMFDQASSFNQPLNNWNVSNVTNMLGLFRAGKFNQDISSWNVGNVTDMAQMFWGNEFFNQNLQNWDVRNVQRMYGIFDGASSFNQDISNWNVSSVTDMNYMFRNTTAFTKQNLSAWNVGNVTSHTDFMIGSGAGNTEPNW